MSRWTMPCWCAYWSASQMDGTIASASSGASLRRLQQLPQAHPIHKLHQQVIKAVGLAEVIDGDDVGMVEPRQRLRLARETLGKARVFLLLAGQDFQRHEAVEPRLARLIDHAHAAAAQAFKDFQLRELAGDLLQGRRGFRLRGATRCAPAGPASASSDLGVGGQAHAQYAARTKTLGRARRQRRAAFGAGLRGRRRR